MAKAVQISAPVSRETKDDLERYSRATGVKKGHLIEAALRHHLRALRELPHDIVVPTTLVVTRRSMERVLRQIESPRPTKALKALMKRRGD
jgi:hypothetical protein